MRRVLIRLEEYPSAALGTPERYAYATNFGKAKITAWKSTVLWHHGWRMDPAGKQSPT